MKPSKQVNLELAYYYMQHDNENYDKVMETLERNTYKYKEEKEEEQ